MPGNVFVLRYEGNYGTRNSPEKVLGVSKNARLDLCGNTNERYTKETKLDLDNFVWDKNSTCHGGLFVSIETTDLIMRKNLTQGSRFSFGLQRKEFIKSGF